MADEPDADKVSQNVNPSIMGVKLRELLSKLRALHDIANVLYLMIRGAGDKKSQKP